MLCPFLYSPGSLLCVGKKATGLLHPPHVVISCTRVPWVLSISQDECRSERASEAAARPAGGHGQEVICKVESEVLPTGNMSSEAEVVA